MKRILIYLGCFLFCATHIYGQITATFYYRLCQTSNNNASTASVSGGQFITFYPGICFDSDSESNSAGNGTLKKTFDNGSERKYYGISYWGNGTTYHFTNNLSCLEVITSTGEKFRYEKGNAPAGVYTSSLISSQRPPKTVNTAPVVVVTEPYQPTTPQSSSPQKVKRKCSLCQGTGLKIQEIWVGSASTNNKKWCNICNREVVMGHSHVKCDLCNGNGYLDY